MDTWGGELDMTTWFVSSDIHSFFTEWMDALKLKGFDENDPTHKIIVCGDLFDRGDETTACYDFALKMLKNNRMVYVKGNHEYLLQELMTEVKRGFGIGTHHILNRTINTLESLTGVNQYNILCGVYNRPMMDKAMSVVDEFINTYCVNYFELDDFIFVHSWLPLNRSHTKVAKDWESSDADWYGAGWGNPFKQWESGITISGKTVVCGHWHTSFAHSKYHNNGDESGDSACYDIFVDDGIMGLDGCVAKTRNVNVLKLKELDDNTILIDGGN
jgi:serine/threonine protein phosphatase 1